MSEHKSDQTGSPLDLGSSQPSSSPARSRHSQQVPAPIRSSSTLLQSRVASSGPSTSSTKSPPPSGASLLTSIPSAIPNRSDRPPNRFRRATDSTVRNDVSSLHVSTPQRLDSSRRYTNQSIDRHLTSRTIRPIDSIGFRFKSSIFSSLWMVNSTPPLRRLHSNDDQSSYLKQLSKACSTRLGIGKPAFLFILIMILGFCDLWRSENRDLDNQDWGPTRFRAGRRTAVETRRLQVQMRQSPFQTLAAMGVLANSHSSSDDPFGLTGRWLRPLDLSTIPLANRGHIHPDVTAVLLSWKRLENLIVIVAHLCQYDFFESIIIWNNNPDQIIRSKDFENTKCPNHKLLIFNSPTNNYFFSRFLACLQSRTKFCYFQDDDCIVNLIRTMYFQFKSLQFRAPRRNDEDDENDNQFSVVVQADPVYSIMYNWEWCFEDRPNRLHTCFAWLGHGSFVTKTAVSAFLSLVSSEKSIPSDSVVLADNFFTTSLNRQPNVIVVPEILGLPLSDRGFSDGNAGLERNRVYIQRGVETISRLLNSGRGPQTFSFAEKNSTQCNKAVIRAAERGDRFFLITNVEPFPAEKPHFNNFEHGLAGWEDRLGITGYHLGRVWPHHRLQNTRSDWERREVEIINSSYAAATDGDHSTYWISPQPVQKNDWVGIGWIDRPIIDINTRMIEIHFITSTPEIFEVDQVIEILQSYDSPNQFNTTLSKYSSSPLLSSAASWERLSNRSVLIDRLQQEEELKHLECSPVIASKDVGESDARKFDCSIKFLKRSSFLVLENSLGLRVRKLNHSEQRWFIYEAFVVGI